jgi:hypothetical protein
MASFEQHINGAVISTGIMLTPVYAAEIVTINQALAILAFGTIGGILPDIDSENSKPIQIAFKIISTLLPFVAILFFAKDMSIFSILLIWFSTSLILHFLFFKAFINVTIHRGIFHSIPMGLLMGQLTIIILHNLFFTEIIQATLCGIFLFFGFIIHLILDEIVSLNVLGLYMKKSLGSALKIYDKKNIKGTIILYILITISFLLFPLEIDILFELLNEIQALTLEL